MPLGLRVVAIMFALRPSERNAERFERWAFVDYDGIRDRSPGWMDAFTAYTRSRATIGHVKRTMRQLIGIGTRQIASDDLRRIGVPVALLWPRHDRFVPLALAESASTWFGWPLHIIEDAGHAAHVERPDAFVSALRMALERSSGDVAASAEPKSARD
jgi:pimeloyl-ACP methyl ester carboxylesterase